MTTVSSHRPAQSKSTDTKCLVETLVIAERNVQAVSSGLCLLEFRLHCFFQSHRASIGEAALSLFRRVEQANNQQSFGNGHDCPSLAVRGGYEGVTSAVRCHAVKTRAARTGADIGIA